MGNPTCLLHLARDHEQMSLAAAGAILREIRAKPDSLLCLATGSSPERTYELLAERGVAEPRLFGRARLLKLDEWGGLRMSDPATCEAYLHRTILDPLGVSRGRFFGWRSRPRDPAAECRRVAAWLAVNGPIDVSILGIGMNGHLGLNEPGPALEPGPHVAKLSATAKAHPMLQASGAKPTFGLTLGMADILRSRKIILLASGAHKAGPMRRLFSGQVSTRFPASFLWLHPALAVFCDRAAALRLRMRTRTRVSRRGSRSGKEAR